jgi:hypothetical protein
LIINKLAVESVALVVCFVIIGLLFVLFNSIDCSLYWLYSAKEI